MNQASVAATRPWVSASLALLAFLGCAVLAVTPGPRATVLVPVAATAGIACAFLAVVTARGGGRYAMLELGPIYGATVAVYAIYPLLGFLVNGLRYGDLNDSRLFSIQPTAAGVARLAWYYVAHLAGFAVAYAVTRACTKEARLAGRYVSRFALVALGSLWLMIQAYFFGLQRHYDWHFETNLDRYAAIANLPLLIAQVTGHLGAIQFTVEVAFLVLLFAYSRRALLLVVPWLGFVGVTTLVQHQSRTEFVLLGFAALVCFHLEVRPLSGAALTSLAVAGTAGFLLFGATRDDLGGLDVRPFRRFFIANEFESLFGNAADLDYRARTGEISSLPPSFFASDLLALVPQQLLPVAKVFPADWYMKSFFPGESERGLGFCFGTVSESILGGGLPDAVARGAALGLIFGGIHRFVAKRRPGPWWFIFYVWLVVLAYNSFRMTTFYLLVRAVYDFLPVVIYVKGSALIFGLCRRAFSASRTAEVAT